MSPTKQKEHFVPKWYLKNFSSRPDRGFIWVYSTELKTIGEEVINNIAQKPGFYGKDFEDFLDPIETRTRDLIQNIITSKNIENITDNQLKILFEFIALQYYRTEHEKERTEKNIKFTRETQTIPKLRIRYKHISPEVFNSLLREPLDLNFFIINIGMALCSKKGLSDLTPYLIRNTTNLPFFTSDDPVVFNTRYHRPNKLLNGFQSPGLQIICPLNKKYCLMLIHNEAYTLKNNNKSLIEITAKSDIHSFNKLQILNSYLQVFSSNNSLRYLQNLHRQSEKIRKSKQFKKELLEKASDVTKEYYNIERKDFGVSFSFLERNPDFVRNKWQRCVEIQKQSPSKTFPPRNEKLVNEVNKQLDPFIFSILENYQLELENSLKKLN